MAKVSAYTAASEPLAGTEELYIVQGGNGRKTTVDAVRGPAAQTINLQTAVAAAGQASIPFTGIPSGANRVTVNFDGYSTSGTSPVIVQLGDAGGIENTGYLGSVTSFNASALTTTLLSSGVALETGTLPAATALRIGHITFERQSGNTWTFSGQIAHSQAAQNSVMAGSKVLSDVLTQLVVTTAGGTDTADAGSVSISWE